MVLFITRIAEIMFDQVFHQSSKVGSFNEQFYANRQYFQNLYQHYRFGYSRSVEFINLYRINSFYLQKFLFNSIKFV
jgi:hypothetical protein